MKQATDPNMTDMGGTFQNIDAVTEMELVWQLENSSSGALVLGRTANIFIGPFFSFKHTSAL